MRRIICILMCLSLTLGGCSHAPEHTDEYKYIIGVSLSNVIEPWVKNMVSEIRTAAENDRTDTNVIFRDAANSPEKQRHDIDQLMDSGIDLLIVVPTMSSGDISSAIGKVYERIPVIVAGINPGTNSYTSFIRFDDYVIGRTAGKYIIENDYRDGDSVIIVGGPDESPISSERRRGFYDTVKGKIPADKLTYCNGEWLRDKAEDRIKDYLTKSTGFDILFAFNDEMAFGAYLAAKQLRVSDAVFIGVDGFSGVDGGRQLVKEGILEATISCPGIGSMAMQMAGQIFDGKKVQKDIVIKTELLH